MSTLEAALGVSGISIVLLFAAMAVIWGLMALMARVPDKKNEQPVAVDETPAEAPAAAVVLQESKTNKAKAAIAAVATALALRQASSRLAPKATGVTTTAWQSAQRANHISRRNQLTSRKRG